MLTDFERLGDHMLNIAEAAAESKLVTLKLPEEAPEAESKGKGKDKIAAAKA
jgi:phosphate:Na+ symporter